MDRHQKISDALHEITGVSNIYFDPPTNKKLQYPCIKYMLADRVSEYANNKRYINKSEYVLYYITRNADEATPIIKQIEALPLTSWDRTYVADGLHHFVYSIIV